MFELLKKRIKNEKGLSLVELLAVIVILAIVAAIAIPAIGNIIENSRTKAVVSDAQNVLSAANIYFSDDSTNGTFKDTDPEFNSYVETPGKLTAITVTKVPGGDNTIQFTAPIKGEQVTITTTMKALNAAKVSKGELTLGNTTYPTTPTTPGP